MSREFRAAARQLSPQNRRVLRRMARYIDSYSLNEVAYEELMSDLTGMALECQKRQQSFAEAVGMDEAAFCHELVANCPRRTRTERVLGVLLFLATWLAAVLPAMYLLEFVFPWMPGACDGRFYLAPASFLCKYAATVLMVAGALYGFKRITYRPKSLVGGLYLLVFSLVFITVSEIAPLLVGNSIVQMSMVAWALVSAVVLLLFLVARRCVAMTAAYQRKKQQLREQEK